ncbi:unnamed protein product, partial [Rotaria sp. Silwood2]
VTLEKLSQSLQENDPLLRPIADTFASCNRIQEAVQMCIELSQWNMGIELARHYNLSELKSLLTRQAKTLLNQNKPFNAIELYKKIWKLFRRSKNSLWNKQKYFIFSAISAFDALQGLLTEETTGSAGVSDTQLLDNVWRPAEAYHFYILAQRQFKANNPERALRSGLTLTEYKDILPVQTIYNLIGN